MSGVSNLFLSAPAASSGNYKHDQVGGHDYAHLGGASTTGDTTPSSDVEEDVTRLRALMSMFLICALWSITVLRPIPRSLQSLSLPNISQLAISHSLITGIRSLLGPRTDRLCASSKFDIQVRGVNDGVEGRGKEVDGNGKEGKNIGRLGSVIGLSPHRVRKVAPWHVYELRRGRTSDVIDDVQVSPDGR